MNLGFDYFQGFFLNRPDPFMGPNMTENKAHLLQILGELNQTDVSLEKVAEFIQKVPKLSYRILRLTNSVAFYTGKKIESLMDAIAQLGLIQIRNWIILLMLASCDDVDPELLERTLIRAKMCETLAKSTHYANPHQAFTVGILSTLDAIFNEPLPSLLAKIQLSDVLNAALLHHVGPLGSLLKCTICYEEANFKQLAQYGFNDDNLLYAYLEGLAYATSALSIISH
jgi:EAL and modified HD-GYP domain-containing signal transduction protein